MGLLNDMFQKQQQISQNPTSVVRTPQQVAYDNLLNREAEINQQNKRNNFVSGLMSGIGGLGKVIANSVVSNPYQKAGAMEGIGEQETRLDGLRQAYDQARQQQNKDYVAQAREQLGLAREDEDKAYNRDLTKEQIAYKKMIDDRNFNNQVKQQELENELRINTNNREQDRLDLMREELGLNRQRQEQAELQQMKDNAFKDRQFKLQEQQLAQQQIDAQNKALQEELKKNQERIFTLINNNSVTPEVGNLILNRPELMPYLKDSGEFKKPSNMFGFLPWKTGGNDNKFDFDYERLLTDMGKAVTKENIAEIKKQLGL